MLPNLPLYISMAFILITFLTVYLFYRATQNSKMTLVILLGWLAIQIIITFSGFYHNTQVLPPRIFLTGVFPTIVMTFALFLTKQGKQFLDSLDAKALTILHTIRIPVEIVLLWLFLQGAIPEIMTFEGRNFDILAGLTAPLIYYFGFVKNKLSRNAMLIWNFVSIALLLNIVITATLCIESPIQQFAFDQPNRAILYFPMSWLPTCVVPVVMFSHFATIRWLFKSF